MSQVWKYTIALESKFTLEMPEGASILYIAVQHGIPCLWARVTPNATSKVRHFQVRGTGHNVEPESIYLGSFQLQGGNLVLHLFEDA